MLAVNLSAGALLTPQGCVFSMDRSVRIAEMVQHMLLFKRCEFRGKNSGSIFLALMKCVCCEFDERGSLCLYAVLFTCACRQIITF